MSSIKHRQTASSRHRLAIVLCCLLVLAAMSLSCQILGSSIEPVEHVRLDSPAVNYEEVAWLSDSAVAFVVSPGHDADLWDLHIALFDLGSEEWTPQDIADSPECRVTGRGAISRLPDSRLGFIEACFHPERYGMSERHEALRALDPESGEVETIQRYAPHYGTNLYAVSPDMHMVAQASGEGSMYSTLQRYVPGEVPHVDTPSIGSGDQLFSDYRVSRSPQWSPDGKKIAVLAAGQGEVERGIGPEILGRQDWKLVLMDVETGDERIMLDGTRDGHGLKWSPSGRHLAFRGKRGSLAGVWLFDMADKSVDRLWPYFTGFDFSPDGHQVIILHDTDGYDGPEFAHPVIIDAPYIGQ